VSVALGFAVAPEATESGAEPGVEVLAPSRSRQKRRAASGRSARGLEWPCRALRGGTTDGEWAAPAARWWPGTFRRVFRVYTASGRDLYIPQVHNDWLETRITFGSWAASRPWRS